MRLLIIAFITLFLTLPGAAQPVAKEYYLLLAGFQKPVDDLLPLGPNERVIRERLLNGFAAGAEGFSTSAAKWSAPPFHVFSMSTQSIDILSKASGKDFFSREQVGIGFFIVDDILLLKKEKNLFGKTLNNINCYVVVTFHIFDLGLGSIIYSINMVWPFQLDTYSEEWEQEFAAWAASDKLNAILPQYLSRSTDIIVNSYGFQQLKKDVTSGIPPQKYGYLRVEPTLKIDGSRASDDMAKRLASVGGNLVTQHAAQHLHVIPFYANVNRALALEQRDPRERQLHAILLSDKQGTGDIRNAIRSLTGYSLQRARPGSTSQIAFTGGGSQERIAYLGDNLFPMPQWLLTIDMTTKRQQVQGGTGDDDLVTGSFLFTLRRNDTQRADICGRDSKTTKDAREKQVTDTYLHKPGIDRGVTDDFATIWGMARDLSSQPLFGPANSLYGTPSDIAQRSAEDAQCKV